MGTPAEAIATLSQQVESLEKKFQDATDQVEKFKAQAIAAAAAAKEFDVFVAQTTTHFQEQNVALNALNTSAGAFTATMGTLLDIQTAIGDGYRERSGYKGNAGANDRGYTEQVATKLQTLITDARSTGSASQSAIAVIIERVLKALQGGIITPDEAIKEVQGLIGPYVGGLGQEIADPNTSALMRMIDQEFQRFLASGSLQ